MKIIYKATSTASAFFFIFACNFCLVECVFASEQHDHAMQISGSAGHHDESENHQSHSDSDKHEAESLYCSSLVAVKTTLSYSTAVKLVKALFSQIVTLERFIPQLSTHSEYKVEFPPGASPPSVFLLNHFTHAPPVSL